MIEIHQASYNPQELGWAVIRSIRTLLKDAAHFVLTAQRHGAEFWDRGLGDLGDALTAAAHSYGFDVEITADGIDPI